MESSDTGLRPSDIIIAVMGITGSGKSTFVSQLADQDVPVGHGLKSLTDVTGVYTYRHRKHGTIRLIDTPGFDDTYVSDTDVLRNIAAFMSATYQKEARLTGVIYMHRITDNRVAGSSLRNIKMFKALCGGDAYKHVVLATSMWDHMKNDYHTAVRRETQLKEDAGFWKTMHSRGSRIMRWRNDAFSASAIVDHLIESRQKHGPATLQIQRELVDERRVLEETSAGKEVNKELIRLKKDWEKRMQQLHKDHKEALRRQDKQQTADLQKQELHMKEMLCKAEEAQRALKTDLEQLMRDKADEYGNRQKELERRLADAAGHMAKHESEMKRLQADRQQSEELYEDMKREFAEDRERLDRKGTGKGTGQDDLESSLKAQYEEEKKKSLLQEEELKKKMAKVKDVTKQLLKFVPPLVGAGLIIAGVATVNPVLITMGGGLMASAKSFCK